MGRVEFGAREVQDGFIPFIEIKFELENGIEESIVFDSNIHLTDKESTFQFLKVIFSILQSEPNNLKLDPDGGLIKRDQH